MTLFQINEIVRYKENIFGKIIDANSRINRTSDGYKATIIYSVKLQNNINKYVAITYLYGFDLEKTTEQEKEQYLLNETAERL